MTDFLRKFFDRNDRDITKYRLVVEKINALELSVKPLTDEQLKQKTDAFRERVQSEWQAKLDQMEKEGVLASERKDKTRKALDEVLDEVLPEVFAVVREAGLRTLGQRHYDVQLIGGLVTHDARIAELRTGEGKTLMATLPLYLNALAGRGAHLVTANDYLSKVGAVWMGPIYSLLGMSVGIIQGQSPETGDEGGSYIFDLDYEDPDVRYTYCRPCSRREAYACDVTYGTNNEFGFDYLRDNMAFDADSLSMRELHYAIIDEVDSILIDEARTPLIISGMVDQDTRRYYTVDRVVRTLRVGKDARTQQEKDDPEHDRNNPDIHYLYDEKQKAVSMTDSGVAKVEAMMGVNNLADDNDLMHYVTAAMKAHACFRKDIDYVIKEGEIIIVDEFTGRLMFGRRYSDGLHQAIEAKENVEIKNESQTLATITFQNLFRLYLKLAGMTGTAKTEEDEFRKIYGLDVVMVPTHRKMVRIDQADIIYKVAEHKFRGIAADILRLYAKQQPVLVGTRSIEMSEKVSHRITGQSLQVLAMVSAIRMKIETDKMDKSRKEAIGVAINADLDTLTLGKLSPIAKELGINPDPLHDDNIRALPKVLEFVTGREVASDDETLDRLDEALGHGVPHNILNAKYHEKEAIIIAEAGRKAAVTIATNMAGRGVDILLGGKPSTQDLNPSQAELLAEAPDEPAIDPETGEPYLPGEGPEVEAIRSHRRGGKPGSVLDTVTTLTSEELSIASKEVCALGGLFILGTERHESRRIDNQLRGRAGRQGDPGESRFYVSLEDELWRLFGDRANHWLLRSTWPDEQAMDAGILSKMIQRAQKKVEEHHFEIRKHVLSYDDVMNRQREIIYAERRKILEGTNLRSTIVGFLERTIDDAIIVFCPESEQPQNWPLDELYDGLGEYFPISAHAQLSDLTGKSRAELKTYLSGLITTAYEDKEREVAEITGSMDALRGLEQHVALRATNNKWMEHLANMDYLREGIGLRGYAQQDPLIYYNKEGFEMFETMQHSIQDEIARVMFHIQFAPQEEEPPPPRREYNSLTSLTDGGGTAGPRQSASPAGRKLGRNDPCHCGSGKKYKLCHYPN